MPVQHPQQQPAPKDRSAKQVIATLRNRLERWELDHLRALSAELSERLERAEDETQRAWESAEFWRQNAMELQETLIEADYTIGMTKEGQISATPNTTGAAQ